jgi:hypothetical protein
MSRCLQSLAVLVALVTAASAQAQPGRPGADDADFSGVWSNDPPPATLAYQNDTFSERPPRLTAWGQARFDVAKPSRGPRGVPVAETDDPVYACYPPGVPRVYLHPFPLEIIHTPGRVLMMFEYDHLNRQIFVDGREHRTDLAPMWMGDSIGRWDGGTLVIETVNFNDKTWLDRTGVPHSEELRVIERIRLVDPDRLEIDITMEDPIAFEEPWRAQRFYRRTEWAIEELSCLDNANFEEYESEILQFDGQ